VAVADEEEPAVALVSDDPEEGLQPARKDSAYSAGVTRSQTAVRATT
jgi:hypothetical protein